MRYGEMHGDNFSQVLMRSLVCIKASRKLLKEVKGKQELSSIEFGLCGGKRKKDDSSQFSLKRQIVLAERGLRSFISSDQEIFDPDIKQPAKKQMTNMINGMKSWLDDELEDWDKSDDEDVDNFDPSESADENEEEE